MMIRKSWRNCSNGLKNHDCWNDYVYRAFGTIATPHIPFNEFFDRRKKLGEQMCDNSICLCIGNKIKYMVGNAFYPFHQDPNFYYLTGNLPLTIALWNPKIQGFVEANAAMILEKLRGGQLRYNMFVQPKDLHQEKWEGQRTGVTAVQERYGADESFEISMLPRKLKEKGKNAEIIYSNIDLDSVPDKPSSTINKFFSSMTNDIRGIISQLRYKFTDLTPMLHVLRLVKSNAELACIKAACKISGDAFNRTIAKRLNHEHEIHATIEYEMRIGGCERSAYVPVVAGGPNALIIHYTKNDMPISSKNLVLVDAGGLVSGYASDITRTWPIDGKFTPAQKDLYRAVEEAQVECIKLCTVNESITLNDIYRRSKEELLRNLRNIGFHVHEGDLERHLYPHNVGHHLGLELHDCSKASSGEILKANQVITIEPGLYIPDNPRWPAAFRGMGVRIEDTVVIGEVPEIITDIAAKHIADIEELFTK